MELSLLSRRPLIQIPPTLYLYVVSGTDAKLECRRILKGRSERDTGNLRTGEGQGGVSSRFSVLLIT